MVEHVFFMHIAKTAGSYINKWLSSSLPDGVVIDHIESRLPPGASIEGLLENGARIISGHIRYHHWLELTKRCEAKFVVVSAVREPIEQLASHILWLDHYNDPKFRSEYLALDESTRRVVDEIGATRLDSPGSLDTFMTNLSPRATSLLDNCQSRYFISGHGSPVGVCEPLTLGHAAFLDQMLDRFDHIVLHNRLREGLIELGEKLGVPLSFPEGKINTAKSGRSINLDSPLVRQVLGKRLLLDQWLWRRLSDKQLKLMV